MASIVIVSGCPGSGKTTLASSLAQSSPRGLHLRSDVFYGFPAAPLEPTLPASHHQNTVIMRALARSARAFAEGGYDVVVDGVIGPWFLPVLQQELSGGPAVSYVVLRVSEPEALRRVRERQGPGASARVRQMVGAFSDLGTFAQHVVDTDRRSAHAVLALVQERVAKGALRLGW